MTSRSVIDDFRKAVREGDVSSLAGRFADDIRFFTSVSHKPFEGKGGVIMILEMLRHVCQDVEFVSEYRSERGVAVSVRGTVKGRQFDGAQFLAFDDTGMITEFRDFVRPLSALLALQEAAGEYLANTAATTAP